VANAGGITLVAQRPRDRLGQAQARIDLAQDDEPAVRRQAAGIERGCERLGLDR
jgi:hypothetical protein